MWPLIEGLLPPATGRKQGLMSQECSWYSFLLISLLLTKTQQYRGTFYLCYEVLVSGEATGHVVAEGVPLVTEQAEAKLSTYHLASLELSDPAKSKVITNGRKCPFLQKSPWSKNPSLQPIT